MTETDPADRRASRNSYPVVDVSREILRQSGHRPWPVPSSSWIIAQRWDDLLFAHWAVPRSAVRELVPAALQIDTYEGDAWLGIVPFTLWIRPRGIPPLPFVSTFPELNVRTYVRFGGRPGVYFFSLDAASRLAVLTARTLFHLNYRFARISSSRRRGAVHYQCIRKDATASPAVFEATYSALPGSPAEPAPDSLDAWLVERYCLYAVSGRGTVRRVEIHHPPWSLRPAEAEIRDNTMCLAAGLSVTGEPQLLHFAATQKVLTWAPERLEA